MWQKALRMCPPSPFADTVGLKHNHAQYLQLAIGKRKHHMVPVCIGIYFEFHRLKETNIKHMDTMIGSFQALSTTFPDELLGS